MEDPKPARPRPRPTEKAAAPELSATQPELKLNPVSTPAPAPTAEYAIADPAEFASNMVRVGQQSQKLLADFFKRQTEKTGSEPRDPLNIGGAFSELMTAMANNPTPMVEAGYALLNDYLDLWESTARRLMGEKVEPVVAPAPGDKRFRDKDWQENQVFDFIKQSYLLTANWMQSTIGKVEGIDPAQQKRIRFYTKQFADAMAPTNFVLTNPEVLRLTLQSNGENLVKGLDHLLEDLDRGHGQLSIRQTSDAFKVGENIATSPGKVIFRNELVELLQYDPSTEQVYERPLLIFPPWINKFYILDLRSENSFIKWLTGQGYTVFVASWVNPDRRLAMKTFEDYMRDGIFAALDAVEEATGVRDPNVVGYCIGGTLLSTTLAYMAPPATTASTPPRSGRRKRISPKPAICPYSLTTRSSKRCNSRWKRQAACSKAAKWPPPSTCCAPTI